MSTVRKQMHQTTIRFDNELWRRIDEESRRIGVSSAQYIRDSMLIRLTQERGSRTLGQAVASGEESSRLTITAVAARSAAGDACSDSQAVWAQARQARDRARSLRTASRELATLRAARRSAAGEGPRNVSEDRG